MSNIESPLRCTEDGCFKDAISARGLCRTHYNAWYKIRPGGGTRAKKRELRAKQEALESQGLTETKAELVDRILAQYENK